MIEGFSLGSGGGATSETLAEVGLFGLQFCDLCFANASGGLVVAECLVRIVYGFGGNFYGFVGRRLDGKTGANLTAARDGGAVGLVFKVQKVV